MNRGLDKQNDEQELKPTVFLALDESDVSIIGVYARREDAVKACESDWAGVSRDRDTYWSGDVLIRRGYEAAVRSISEREVE